MKISKTRTKGTVRYYLTRSVRKAGRSTSEVVERLGTREEIQGRIGAGADVDEWAKAYARRRTEEERAGRACVQMELHADRQLPLGGKATFNVGYLFLQAVYSSLGLPAACRAIQARHPACTYSLDGALSRLVYARVLDPCSKRATLEGPVRDLAEPSPLEQQHIYRSLDLLAEGSEEIQEAMWRARMRLGMAKGKGPLYYDCTNYYFEIQQEDGFRMYGPSKEHRPSPVVGMGLMMDAYGMPVAFGLYPGNRSEQLSLTPLEDRIRRDMGLSRVVVCTDAGLSSCRNRIYNSKGDLQFVTAISLRQQKADVKAWALDPKGWHVEGSDAEWDISEAAARADSPECPPDVRARLHGLVFWKSMWASLADPDTGEEYGQTIAATFSLKYRDWQRGIREDQLQRAQEAIDRGTAAARHRGAKDPLRLVKVANVTEEGEVAGKAVCEIDGERVAEEARWDGLYGIATSLDERDVPGALKVAAGRWEVEECFRIMKTDFRARPVYVSTKEHIEAHFLTCFVALAVYRVLERMIGGGYTTPEILSCLRSMRMERIPGKGWRPLYERTELTDRLHEAFGFRTDYEVVPERDMQRIFRQTRSPKAIATSGEARKG